MTAQISQPPPTKPRRKPINPDDPRIKRTIKLLGDTLIELIIEKGYHNVTIRDITDRAQVSRTTFYLHFETIDDLLFASIRAMYDDLAQGIQVADYANLDDVEKCMCQPGDFEHVQRYVQFYRAMMSEQGSMTFTLRVLDYLATIIGETMRGVVRANSTTPQIPLEVMSHVAAGAEIGIMIWWINNNMPHSPPEMAKMLYDINANGLWWGLGVDREKSIEG
jgi:AcrR family transcriptional regulator